MSTLASWRQESFTAHDETRPVFRKGSGPGVVVIHEVPSIHPGVIRFADEVVDAGFTVVMPSLVGTPGKDATNVEAVKALAKVCVSREFSAWALHSTAPVTRWLSALATDLHARCGGPGVGAVGMCFSGGFALAMMVDSPVVAPVLSQPSLPLFVRGGGRGAALQLSPDDLAVVKEKVAAGCPVLGLRYSGDPMVGSRFDTLRTELGDGFLAVELPGRKHSVLTVHRDDPSVARVLGFFAERLGDQTAAAAGPASA